MHGVFLEGEGYICFKVKQDSPKGPHPKSHHHLLSLSNLHRESTCCKTPRRQAEEMTSGFAAEFYLNRHRTELVQLDSSEQHTGRAAQNHPEGVAGGLGGTAQLLCPSGHQHFPDVIFCFLHTPLQVRLLLLQGRKPRGELRSTLALTARARVLGPSTAHGRAASSLLRAHMTLQVSRSEDSGYSFPEAF